MKKISLFLYFSLIALIPLMVGCGEKKSPNPFGSSVLDSISFTFTDQDKDDGEVQGEVKLSPTQTIDDATKYVLRWTGTQSAKEGVLIGEVDIKGAGEVLYTFPENSKKTDTYIVLFLKNETGETNSGLTIQVADTVEAKPAEPEEEAPVAVVEPEVETPKLTAIDNSHFDFDKAVVKPEVQEYLKGLFSEIENKSEIKLRLSGHCDERGSNEYNLSLGERRALAVKRYLTAIGLNSDNLSTVSFGEEKPLDTGKTEEAWAKNRRVEFEILSQ